MIKEGLGEKSTFANCHPIVNVVYFALVIGITMFSMNPWFITITIFFAWTYSILLSGKKAIKYNILFTIPIIIIMSVINALFINNGATVLFFLNDNRVTLEAFVYGIAAAALISAVIIWFSCFNVVMSADKLIYLFGRITPVLALTLSMIFRFIPLLKERFKEIVMGQKCMGRHRGGSIFFRMRQRIKEVSILVSWSLEAAIETSDSMEARGYGLHGRTSFHLFKLSYRDKILLVLELIFGLITILGCMTGLNNIYYYPKIVLKNMDLWMGITLLTYMVLMSLPIVLDIRGEKKWQEYRLEA